MSLQNIFIENVYVIENNNNINIIKQILTNFIKPYKKKLDPTSPDFLSDNWISWSSPSDFLSQFSEWCVLEHFRTFTIYLLSTLSLDLPFLSFFFIVFFITLVGVIAVVKYNYALYLCNARDHELFMLSRVCSKSVLYPSSNYKQECKA